MAEKAEIVLSARDTTANAFASAKRNLQGLQSGVVGIAARFAGITAVAVTVGEALNSINPAKIIQAADEFNKLSQRTGIAVETLSGYSYAARLADVSNEELDASLKKLNINIAAAARGETEQAAAFKAIGVSVVDASGKVRTADKVFEDIADRFATYGDGANKVALANALGGRSFERLIPILNGGKQGLTDARAELEKFGGVIGADLARKSEQFNDNLTRLAVASDALKVSIASGLIDSLVKLSDRLVDAAKSGNTFIGVLNALNDLPNPAAQAGADLATRFQNLFKDSPEERIAKLTAGVADLQKQLAVEPGNSALEARLVKFQQRLKEVNAGLDTQREVARRSFLAGEKDFTQVPLPRKDAPALPKTGSAATGADNAEALLRKQLEGRLKAIQSTLERERDLFQFSESQLQEQFNRGEISIAQFYDAKNKIALDSLAAQSEAGAKEVALFNEFQAKFSKPQDKADLGNRALESIERQARAFRESGQAATVAEQARVRATEDFRRSLTELDAQLADLSGNKYGAEILRNAQRLEDARALLSKGGGDPQRLTQLQGALDAQAAFNSLQEKSARINEQAARDEEAYFIKANRLGLSRADVERDILAIREKSIAGIDRLIAETAKLTEVSTDPELLAFYESLRLARERAFDAKDPGLLRFNELAATAGETLASGFQEAILEGKKLDDVIGNLAKRLNALVFDDLITKPLSKSLTNFIQGLGEGGQGGGSEKLFSGIADRISKLFEGGGGATGGGGFAALFATIEKSFGGFLGSLFHNGGVVGEGGMSRAVSPMVFAGAPRYHSGGLAGLAPDEFPAILRKREEVLRTDDPRHRDNGGRSAGAAPQVVYNTINVPAGTSRETGQQLAARAAAELARASRRNG